MALEDETQAALAHLSKVRNAADEATRALGEVTHTQVSKRKMLSVTVGLSGELQSLTFNGEAYRSLAPPELAALIVETVTAARQGAQAEASELLNDVFPDASGTFDLFSASPSNLDDFMTGLLRVAGNELSDEQVQAFQKSWRGEL